MKLTSAMPWMLVAFALCAGAIAATAEMPVDLERLQPDDLRLIGIMRSERSFTVFVSHNRAKPQQLDGPGAVVGPYRLCAVDVEKGFADFERQGAIYRVWLPEATVKHGRALSLGLTYRPLLERGVSVFGAVRQPGLIRHVDGLTISQAIAKAGGPSTQADLSRVKLMRKTAAGDLEVTEINVDAIVKNNGKPVVRLEKEDVVEVGTRLP